jgi:hypothetical protein
MQQISGWHSSPREEMRAHPAFLEVVGCGLVREDMDKELSLWLESARDFGHEKLVILHMLEELTFPLERETEEWVAKCTSIETTLSKLSGSNS